MTEPFNENTFKNVVAQVLQVDPQAVKSDLSLGSMETWDSLNHFNLIFAIEEAFEVRFESEEIPSLKTIQLLREAILRHLGGS